jgi:type II secretory pathway pseudopilin PulG
VTLIEIIAGLIVLAVLVSAITIARGRFMRQWGEGQRRLDAAAAVDRMLAGWLGGEGADNIPVPARGLLNGVEGCTWRTEWVPDAAATRLGAGKVRLEVFQGAGRLMAVEVLKHRRTRADAAAADRAEPGPGEGMDGGMR